MAGVGVSPMLRFDMPDVIDTTERTCWTTDYWLGHCEGYRVFAAGAPIGFVERVLVDADGEATGLAVRIGDRPTELLTIPLEAIERFDPAGELVLIALLARIPARL
jgi:hypothetical protein